MADRRGCELGLLHSWINTKTKYRGIDGIMVNNCWVDSVDKVKEEATKYFQNQFKARKIMRPELSRELFVKKISEVQNSILEARFCELEIKEAIWECDSNKSPGFTFAFVKNNWENMKQEIVQMMEKFYEKGKIVKGLNSSFIVLIPKKDKSISFEEYRPTSLLGCIYKIIAKILARRLSKVLDGVISGNQSAFVGGRQILDSIVILNELIDEAKKKKLKRFIFKVDFANVYDTVEWNFIDEMMSGMNFSAKWRSWIQECISTTSASVLINVSPSPNFSLERGIR